MERFGMAQQGTQHHYLRHIQEWDTNVCPICPVVGQESNGPDGTGQTQMRLDLLYFV